MSRLTYLRGNQQSSTSRQEHRQRLQALVDSPEWQLVKSGLRAQQSRTMQSLAMGIALTEQQMREKQAEYRLLLALIARPVEYLMQFDEIAEE